MNTNCDICDEKFNKINRKHVSCAYCEKVCCSDCFGNYLINSGFEPSCLFCKKNITKDFVIKNLTKKFYAVYSNFKDSIVFSREESLLPSTQPIVNNIKKIKEVYLYVQEIQENIRKTKNELREIRLKYKNVDKKNKEEKIALKTEIENKKNDISTYDQLVTQAYMLMNELKKIQKKIPEDNTPKYIMKCPDEDCKGFLSSSYKCGTCSNYFCSDCHLKKKERHDESHVCNEDTKATVSLLKLDTKSCPNCMTPIYKVSGCDQMWCLTCKTAFSWNTGKIDNGYIHNPEYFRYMRDNNLNIERNPLDRPNDCNQLPQYYVLQNATISRPVTISQQNALKIVTKWYRLVSHIKYHEMIILPSNLAGIDHTELRIKYLLDLINKETWKKTLRMRLKKNEKNHEIYQVYDLFCQVITENFNRYLVEKDAENLNDECHKIMKYCNTLLDDINDKYNSKNTKYTLTLPLY